MYDFFKKISPMSKLYESAHQSISETRSETYGKPYLKPKIKIIVTKSDEFVQSRRFISNTWLI